MVNQKPELLLYTGTGVKSIPISSLNAWSDLLGTDPNAHYDITAREAFERVAWLFRGVHLRASAVSSMPFEILKGKRVVTDRPELKGLLNALPRLLYLTEASLVLYGAGYWVKERNALGGNLKPRFLAAASMAYGYDKNAGITGFTRDLGDNDIRTYKPNEIVYFWIPDPDTEIGPGMAPATAALRAAGLLDNLDTFAEKYFARGAIKATLLQVEGTPPKGELEKLENWWNRLLAGVDNAWKSIAIKMSVKPVVIGEGLEDIATDKLTQQKREDIATALGIPHTVLFSDAANFATAAQDDFHFYDKTITPECETVLETPLNEQLFNPLGYDFKFKPDQLETYQQYELQKAQAIQVLTGKPILTVNEGRELIGRPPMPKDAAPAPVQAPATDNSAPVTDNVTPPPAPVQDSSTPAPAPDTQKSRAAELDLYRWRRKALKAARAGKPPAVVFYSEHIPADTANAILMWLESGPGANETPADMVYRIFSDIGGLED